jgi:hypothetical protein
MRSLDLTGQILILHGNAFTFILVCKSWTMLGAVARHF